MAGSDLHPLEKRRLTTAHTQLGHSRAKEFAPVRITGAPRMPNSKSAYDRLFLTRFGCRERRSQLRVFIATITGEAIIEVNPG